MFNVDPSDTIVQDFAAMILGSVQAGNDTFIGC